MSDKKHTFELRPIKKEDLAEVTEMIRNSRMELFFDFFKTEVFYNYKFQVRKIGFFFYLLICFNI